MEISYQLPTGPTTGYIPVEPKVIQALPAFDFILPAPQAEEDLAADQIASWLPYIALAVGALVLIPVILLVSWNKWCSGKGNLI